MDLGSCPTAHSHEDLYRRFSLFNICSAILLLDLSVSKSIKGNSGYATSPLYFLLCIGLFTFKINRMLILPCIGGRQGQSDNLVMMMKTIRHRSWVSILDCVQPVSVHTTQRHHFLFPCLETEGVTNYFFALIKVRLPKWKPYKC